MCSGFSTIWTHIMCYHLTGFIQATAVYLGTTYRTYSRLRLIGLGVVLHQRLTDSMTSNIIPESIQIGNQHFVHPDFVMFLAGVSLTTSVKWWTWLSMMVQSIRIYPRWGKHLWLHSLTVNWLNCLSKWSSLPKISFCRTIKRDGSYWMTSHRPNPILNLS